MFGSLLKAEQSWNDEVTRAIRLRGFLKIIFAFLQKTPKLSAI
jgi:hypothetical protein